MAPNEVGRMSLHPNENVNNMKKQRGTGTTTDYTSKLDEIRKAIMRNIEKYQRAPVRLEQVG